MSLKEEYMSLDELSDFELERARIALVPGDITDVLLAGLVVFFLGNVP